ncbi:MULTISPECIES: methyl-accepting chemotaxis protein [unclassified Agarivorans]|uniref:methyl-accepting chemotaxis protein n=1 Tax=unclassified Agarivorans TaxID=2636026 RepID=UPI003D7E3CAE
MRIFRTLSIIQLTSLSFTILGLCLLAMAGLSWQLSMPLENSLKQLNQRDLPRLASSQALIQALTQSAQTISQAENSHQAGELEALNKQIQRQAQVYFEQLKALSALSTDTNSAQLQQQSELWFTRASQVLSAQAPLLKQQQQLAEHRAQYQLLSIQLNQALGQLRASVKKDYPKMLLTNVDTALSLMQAQAARALNGQDLAQVKTALRSAKAKLDLVEADFSELITRLGLSHQDISRQLPLLLSELTGEQGIVSQYSAYLQSHFHQQQQRLALQQQSRILSQQLSDWQQARQTQTAQQLVNSLSKLSQLRQGQVSASAIAIGFCLSLGLLLFITIRQPLKQLLATLSALAKGELQQQCHYRANNEFGLLSKKINQVIQQQREVVLELQQKSQQLESAASSNQHHGLDIQQQLNQQRHECLNVASAMSEMEQAIQDVAGRAEHVSQNMQQIQQLSEQGANLTTQANHSNHQLISHLSRSGKNIEQLAEQSQVIGSILEVIDGITQQTNLLALNAAIEAARAGEQGRGFAVVADEVRQLAQRSASSTKQIQGMIEQLQQVAHSAVSDMQTCTQAMDDNQIYYQGLSQHIQQVSESVSCLAGLNHEISIATGQQRNSSLEVSRSMEQISQSAQHNYAVVSRLHQASEQLEDFAQQQLRLCLRFHIDAQVSNI